MPDSASAGTATATKGVRITAVDTARGLAILMMVAYHITFDIQYFGIAAIDLNSLPLLLLQRVTGTLFVMIAGVSLTLNESHNKEGYVHYLKRGLMLGAVALLITIATWIYPHEGFIQFGVIDMLALSTLIAPFFFRFGWVNLTLGAIIVLVGIWLGTSGIYVSTHALFWLGINDPGYYALDNYPMLPWFGVVLIGIWLGQTLFPAFTDVVMRIRVPGEDTLASLGKNSLVIYLVHQPLIVGIILLLQNHGIA
jgi:uncharacterized membrane protein